ncbi:MAG: stage VI sporulation protein F [Erysipelotrichaceae bacterium]|nr:stage VI sporulation protein F [Erysipelotrichaceae bacterium]
MQQDNLLDKVSKKTNVSKDDILALASDLQTKDLNNENDIKDFIDKIAHITNKEVSQQQMSKIISIIQNNQVPQNFNDMV